MKLRNANLSLAILIGLMFLSFAFFVVAEEQNNTTNNVFLDSDQDGLTDAEEKTYGTDPRKADTDGDGYSDGAEVRSGYDPRKPAPGDKVVVGESPSERSSVLGQNDTKKEDPDGNITEKISQKISQITTATDEEQQNVTIEEIQTLVNDALNATMTEEDLPKIKKEDIKILKQNYSKYSDEKAAEKKKEDFTNYITTVFYILSSNSPKPITSSSDISSVVMGLTEQIISAVSSRNSKSLDDLEKSGEKIEEQLKEVEVPEELIDLHIKAMSYAIYSKELKGKLNSNSEDPIKDIANLSKIRAFIGSLTSFTEELGSKFAEYGITYDENVKNKLKSLGIEPPKISESELNALLDQIETSSSSESDSSE